MNFHPTAKTPYPANRHAPQHQHHARRRASQARCRIGPVAGAHSCGQIGVFSKALACQGSRIVAKRLCIHIHQQGVLLQPGNTLQIAAMLEPLERVFKTLTLMVKLSQHCCGKVAACRLVVYTRVWPSGVKHLRDPCDRAFDLTASSEPRGLA